MEGKKQSNFHNMILKVKSQFRPDLSESVEDNFDSMNGSKTDEYEDDNIVIQEFGDENDSFEKDSDKNEVETSISSLLKSPVPKKKSIILTQMESIREIEDEKKY
mmetsp:Transcript_6437/g.5532  ORF Transcript_6437/g.5532 Transcript_6437/m.5532 type:complete len:105 (-) Transcript_6437:8-322(-)